MEVHVRVRRQPVRHLGRGVGGQVVEHHVDLGAGVRIDRLFHEREEVRAVTRVFALPLHLSGTDVQRGEQVRGALCRM